MAGAGSRLFFALWPDSPVREALERAAAALQPVCGGRPVAPRNLHATLAFLGQVDSGRVPQLDRLAGSLPHSAFDLRLDHIATFPRAGVVYAGARCVPTALRVLARELADALRAGGFRSEARVYVPHVTLLRDATTAVGPPLPPLEVLWQVRHIVLAESIHGPRGRMYAHLRRFMLSP